MCNNHLVDAIEEHSKMGQLLKKALTYCNNLKNNLLLWIKGK